MEVKTFTGRIGDAGEQVREKVLIKAESNSLATIREDAADSFRYLRAAVPQQGVALISLTKLLVHKGIIGKDEEKLLNL